MENQHIRRQISGMEKFIVLTGIAAFLIFVGTYALSVRNGA
jgi:cell division protein FtsL